MFRKKPSCRVQRYEDAHALIPGEIGTRQVASEKPRVGNSRVTADARATLAPTQICARCGHHALKEVGPGCDEVRRGGCESLARGGDCELRQRHGMPITGSRGTRRRQSAQPDVSRGRMENRILSGHGKWLGVPNRARDRSEVGQWGPAMCDGVAGVITGRRDDGENKGSARSKLASPEMPDAMQSGERLEVTGKGGLGDQDGGYGSIGTDVHGLHDRAVLDALENAPPEVRFVGVA